MRPDGSAIRDYIDVVDLSRAHVVSIDRLLAGKTRQSPEIFNLGTGKGLSVFEIIREFTEATGVEVRYKVVDRRDGDVEKVWADTKRANEVLGWKTGTPLKETLLSAWKWEQNLRSGRI